MAELQIGLKCLVADWSSGNAKIIRTLVIDLDRIYAATLGQVLNGQGCQVHVASTTSEAIALLHGKRFDAILLDIDGSRPASRSFFRNSTATFQKRGFSTNLFDVERSRIFPVFAGSKRRCAENDSSNCGIHTFDSSPNG